jgi:multidrug efflux pump subunit AcrA (membrane-fusion protein)
MWMQSPGKIRPLLILGPTLALLALLALPVLAKPKDKTAPAPAPSVIPETGISFNGKVFCSLKRRVDLPFKGTITSILVHSGDRVTAGQVLARYRLAPEAIAQIRQRLSPPQISESEVKLSETERSLVPLQAKQRELTQLAAKKLAPSQGLAQSNRDVRLMEQERTALQTRLRQDRQAGQDDLAVLQKQLGKGVGSGRIPREAALVAPIDGYIIWVAPELQEKAELDPTPGVFQVGVMNPMIVRGRAFEIEALQIKPGETAEITLESLPGKKFQGKVTRISWASMTPNLDQPSYYDVELTVPNPDLLLKDGLKAQILVHKKATR